MQGGISAIEVACGHAVQATGGERADFCPEADSSPTPLTISGQEL